MERRPRLSGVLLGLLTFKPQIGILFPFALFVSRKWRVRDQRDSNERVTDRHIYRCLWFSRMAVLHPRAGRSRTKFGARFRKSLCGWNRCMAFFGWPASVHPSRGPYSWPSAGAVTAVVCWVWARPLPHSSESCGSLQRGPDGDAVRAWARSMRPRDSRCLLGQGRPCARISAWRPLDRALLLDRDLLGLSRFLQRVDPMPSSSCSCCSAGHSNRVAPAALIGSALWSQT